MANLIEACVCVCVWGEVGALAQLPVLPCLSGSGYEYFMQRHGGNSLPSFAPPAGTPNPLAVWVRIRREPDTLSFRLSDAMFK